jgi:hypothetical protein
MIVLLAGCPGGVHNRMHTDGSGQRIFFYYSDGLPQLSIANARLAGKFLQKAGEGLFRGGSKPLPADNGGGT